MVTDKAQLAVGAALVGVFAGFWCWHSPPAKKLTRDEIDHYLETISKYPAPHDTSEFIARVRSWAEADDGKPILMLNLLRYFPELHRFLGAPDFHGSPQEANAYYEKRLTPRGCERRHTPLAGGTVLGENLIRTQPMRENWSTAMMVRYPSRRTFLQLLADPTYADLETYKLMALEIDLVPLSSEKAIPDLRWIAGGSLVTLFLGTGWLRAARR